MADRQLRGLLLLAGAGAAVALVNLFGVVGALTGLGLMAVGVVLSAAAAPQPGAPGANWWNLMAAGTGLVLIGVPIELALETPGGLIVGAGSALVVIGVALGLP